MELIGTEYASLLLDENDPSCFNEATFAQFIKDNAMRMDCHLRKYKHLSLCNAGINKRLNALFAEFSVEHFPGAWRIQRDKGYEYYEEHPNGLRTAVERFINRMKSGDFNQLNQLNHATPSCENGDLNQFNQLNHATPSCENGDLNQFNQLNQAGYTPSPNEWEQPIPFHNMAVPSFPIECLPDVLGDFASAVAEETQTPVDMAVMGILDAVATAVHGKYQICGKQGWFEPLNLYTAVAANPGERKSAVLSRTSKPLYDYEMQENERLKPLISLNKTQHDVLVKKLEKRKNDVANEKNGMTAADVEFVQKELDEFKVIHPKRIISDDSTPEALTKLLAENNGRMAIISAEGGVFDSMKNGYSQRFNIDVFLKGHSGDPIKVDRIGRPSEHIPRPTITMGLFFQPSVLSGLIGDTDLRGRGLAARFLIVVAQSLIGHRRFDTTPMPEEVRQRYHTKITDLLSIPEQEKPITITITPEAHELNRAFFNELERKLVGELEELPDFGAKLHGAILRIAGLLHMVNQDMFAENTPVPAGTMQDAITIGWYLLEHAKLAYLMMGVDENASNAQYIMKRLGEKRPESITRTDLQRLCQRFHSVGEMDKPLQLLIDNGYLIADAPQWSGRGRPPAPIYFVNPLSFEQDTPQ